MKQLNAKCLLIKTVSHHEIIFEAKDQIPNTKIHKMGKPQDEMPQATTRMGGLMFLVHV